MTELFTSTCCNIFSLYIPNKVITCDDRDPKWMTAGRIKTRAANFLKFPMTTAMHGKSRVLSAISVCDNQQNFKMVSRQWRSLSGLGVGVVITGWCKLKVRARVEFLPIFFSAVIFISVFSGLMDFNDILILCSRPTKP